MKLHPPLNQLAGHLERDHDGGKNRKREQDPQRIGNAVSPNLGRRLLRVLDDVKNLHGQNRQNARHHVENNPTP
ncbi:MAG: hypothetical protein ACI9WU_002301, partial [Myxococcota bacterium]